MATLDQMREEYQKGLSKAQHVMIVGAPKTGKSDWAASIALAGGTVIYVDSDNGFATLMERLKHDESALKRVHYFNPADIADFVELLLDAPKVRYNVTRNREFRMADADTDDLCELIPSGFINKPIVLVIDSWTTLAYSAVKRKAKQESVDLTQIEKFTREIYGGVGFRLTNIAQMIQLCPFNIVVQAHPDMYEQKEKPPGRVGEVNEKDMIIKATYEVPMSGSKPHGFTLGKYFTNIGWLEVGLGDKRVLDFSVRRNRISGGSLSGKGDPRKEYSFASLFYGGAIPPADLSDSIRYMTVGEFKESLKTKPAAKPAPTTIKPTGSPTAVNPLARLGK